MGRGGARKMCKLWKPWEENGTSGLNLAKTRPARMRLPGTRGCKREKKERGP